MQSYFNELLVDPFNELVERAVNEGKKPVGFTCDYVPEVLLSVGDLFPIQMRAPGIYSTETADLYLTNVICSYLRSLLEISVDQRLDFLKGIIFSASCDQFRRLFDNIAHLIKPDFMHILDLPPKTGERALKWYVEEVQNLREKLADHFEEDLSDEILDKAIIEHNEFLELMRSIGDLRKQPEPPLSGYEFHSLLMAAATTPKYLIRDKIAEFSDSLAGREGLKDYRARLMLVGALLDDPEYIGVIESVGGLVVADRMCTGSVPGLESIPRQADPITDIAAHNLRSTQCPRMMENFSGRVEKILETVKEFSVDGVVIQTIKFCDTWGIESSPLISKLRQAGVPVLRLEREYQMSGEGQLKTRVQAFLESMGK